MKLVVALGGNMLSDSSNKNETFDDQRTRAISTAKLLLEIEDMGYDLVITHGNGPQVGSLLLQQQQDIPGATKLPLNILGALSQGEIGVTLQHAMLNQYRNNGAHSKVIVIPTTVLVSADDPGFENPTKPVGPFYTEEEYQNLDTSGKKFISTSKGWRRVVPSPIPRKILEAETIDELNSSGYNVISVGGGGSPTIEHNGQLELVDAVIDKDLASSLLAREIKADILLILTNVDGVYGNFGKENQELIAELRVEKAEKMLDEEAFGVGSMGPKVRAGIEFANFGTTIITSPERAIEALQGKAGTRIIGK